MQIKNGNKTLGTFWVRSTRYNVTKNIEIDSQSPPRSALGGSSVAAVALIAAFLKLTESDKSAFRLNRRLIALTAYQIEQSVAGVPCGIQDQLAAAYGGVNIWHWQADAKQPVFKRQCAVRKDSHQEFERHLLIAYCGKPHVSKDVNGLWVRQFLAGRYRDLWAEIIMCTRKFAAALVASDYKQAVIQMNRETAIRRTLTPEVLDNIGEKLIEAVMGEDSFGKTCGLFTGCQN